MERHIAVVHEADKSNGDRKQKVDIYFNLIGQFTPPKVEPDKAALKGERRKQRIRELKHMSQRHRHAAKKAELEAARATMDTKQDK